MTPEEETAILALTRNQVLVILPTEKGNAAIVMDHDKYDRKMQEILNDDQTYRNLKKNPAPTLKGSIPDKLYEMLRSSAGQNPLMYGLPKVHKPNIPMCPIISFVKSPTYQLSKHLSDLLSPLVGQSPSAVRNSREFVQLITTQTLAEDEMLVSFGVVSLFMTIPTDSAIETTQKCLEKDETLEGRTCLNMEEIISLLKLCLNATYLTFRETHYQQTFCTTMGSPVSVTVANLVIEEI